MVGGHKSVISERDSERLYRCQFPVRPGALMGFFKDFGSKWNISLFHYQKSWSCVCQCIDWHRR